MENHLYHGDCLEIMDSILDRSVDLIFTDLPFGITAPKWDQVLDMERLWTQYRRLLKPAGTVALFSSQPFTTKLIQSNEKEFRYCWYWIKNQGTNFFHAKSMPIRKVEEICIFRKGRYNPQITDGHIPTNSARGQSKGQAYHGVNTRDEDGGKTTRYPDNVLEFKCVNNYARIHSSEKPVELLEYIIKTYTDEGDRVLDSCAGSGSLGVACLRTNRYFTMIEKEMKYVELIRDRLKNS